MPTKFKDATVRRAEAPLEKDGYRSSAVATVEAA